MKDGLTLPLIIQNSMGELIEGLLMNEKGFRKSIENSELWTIHPGTGRLLPSEKYTSFVKLEDKNGWYVCTVEASGSSQGVKKSGQQDINEVVSPDIISHLAEVIHKRKKDMPEGSYTTHLFEKGIEKIRKKTGEEAIELILARDRDEIIYEAADLVYHSMVLLEEEGIQVEEVLNELRRREG